MSRGATAAIVAEIRLLRETLSQQARAGTGPYLRGDGAAAAYLEYKDPQGRSFRTWAESVHLPYTEIGGVRTYRKRDIDRLWARHAVNQSSLVGEM